MKNAPIDEREIIRIFQDKFGNRQFISEDVEMFSLARSKLAFGIDSLVESTDVPAGFKPDKVARKSIVACVSDFAAKGVWPKFGFISAVIPARYSRREVTMLADGFADASREFGFKILGGDTNEGQELSLHVCLIGVQDKTIRRRGARSGDLIFVTGLFGYARAGLEIILYNMRSSASFGRRAKSAVFDPKARLDFGVAIKNTATSSMDSSDGLSCTLHEMARQSKKRFLIDVIPTSTEVLDFAKLNKLNPFGLVFDGGEEYELVFTAPKQYERRLANISKRLGVKLTKIGRVVPGFGVGFESKDESFEIRDGGWRHLEVNVF